MAITRSQQAKQMLQDGGRIGLRFGGEYQGRQTGRAAPTGFSATQAAANVGKASTATRSRIQNEKQQEFVRNQIKDLVNKQQEEKAFEPFESLIIKDTNVPAFIPGSSFINLGLGATKKGRQNLLNKNVDFFRFDPRTQKAREKYGLDAQGYKDYMSARLAGEIDAAGNPIMSEDNDNNILLPVDTTFNMASSDMDQGTNTTEEDEGLRLAFRADGGRAGFAEGGGIEQRLEQLGGDVTSAEQMLQGINKRLETAESSLGSGGGLGTLATLAGSDQPFNPGNFQPALPGVGPSVANITVPPPPLGTTFTPLPENKNIFMGNMNPDQPGSIIPLKENPNFQNIPEEFRSGFANYLKENPNSFGFGGQAMSSVGLPGGGSVMFGDTGSAGAFRDYLKSTGFNPPGPQVAQLPAQRGLSGIPAAGYADGGNVVGGEFDFETARQMYGLGKLVKKATRAVKKIVKSPIGKAALLYTGAGALGNLAGGSGLAGMFRGFTSPSTFLGGAKNIFSSGGLKNILVGGKDYFGERARDYTEFSGLFGKGGKLNPFSAISAVSALAGALTPEQEQEAQQLADNTGFSIEEARNAILQAAKENYAMDLRARAFRAGGGLMRLGYQEGGDAEPVAKKTMPLIDMDGKEKDYRETGGFVDMGRMERADDVPARLSKNEFVFTADAVRNAGDGDIDKGAEVMYNMMKNLEAGGEVSEESQGLEGARRMFQTSQRLEEVL